MIATQTILPAAVGFVLLGDKVREGWIPGAILGLVLAVLGAVTLARYEAERPESLTVRESSRNRR
jgi:drug/metabolite transporter (DMT)-like permease